VIWGLVGLVVGWLSRTAVYRYKAWRQTNDSMSRLRDLVSKVDEDPNEGPPPPLTFTPEEISELLGDDR